MSKRRGKIKLMMTAGMLAMSIVLLASASMAWFTMSTAPEISGMQVTLFTDRSLLVSRDKDTGFTQSINIADLFQYYAPLKPVSTVDGIHWFIPKYDSDGALEDPSKFEIDTMKADGTYNHGNVMLYEKNDNGEYVKLSDNEYIQAGNNGYFVYADFYLATELVGGCAVKLSAPDILKNNIQAWEKDEENEHGAKYGSYALAAYAQESDGVYTIDNNLQTAIRVGFLIGEGENQSFVIYEPNADQRSDILIKPTDTYVSNYNFIENENYDPEDSENNNKYLNYVPNAYIPTYPIKAVENENGELVGAISEDAADTIIQLASTWDDTKVKEKYMRSSNDPWFCRPNSNDISHFGQFVVNNEQLNYDEEGSYGIHVFEEGNLVGMDVASERVIVNLPGRDPSKEDETHGEAVKIRMFVWIEGQDADCWNDIAGGTFVLNLEFAAQS